MMATHLQRRYNIKETINAVKQIIQYGMMMIVCLLFTIIVTFRQ